MANAVPKPSETGPPELTWVRWCRRIRVDRISIILLIVSAA
jgi:hypothetical protein